MKIYDGRQSFYQWDVNQKIVSDFKVGEEVHFHNIRQSEALVVAAYEYEGSVVVDVPNILLQNSYPIVVYRCAVDDITISTVQEQVFEVEQRAKPSDYVYTETEVLTITTVVHKAIEDAVASGDFKGDKGDKGDKGERGEKGEPGKDGIDGKNGLDGVDGITPQKGVDYYTPEEKAELVEDISKEVSARCANAIKATASGEVVRVDDVSPIEHTIKAKVSCKNLFNSKAFPTYVSDNNPYISEAGEGYIVVTTPNGYSGNGVSYPDIKLYEICPNAVAGQIYTFSFKTNDNANKIMYLSGVQLSLVSGNSYIFTKDMLESEIHPYGINAQNSGEVGDCRIFDIQLELGDTATEYEPYIDPTTVTVTRYGVDETDNPQTYTPDADGTVEIASLSPTMTLLTDTDGAIIDLEYNQDSNAAIGNVKADIRTLDNDMSVLKGDMGDVETALEHIIAIQETLIGGDA